MVDPARLKFLGTQCPGQRAEPRRDGVGAEAVSVDPRSPAPRDDEPSAAPRLGAHAPEVVLPPGRGVDDREMAVGAPWDASGVRDPHAQTLDGAGPPGSGAVDDEQRVVGVAEVDRASGVLRRAGIAGKQESRLSKITPQGFTEVMLVNALGPLRIADGFLDLVTRDGIVAVVSSGLGSIADNDSGGYEPYRMSKAALDMGLRSIAARRRDKRTWLAVDPGWVQTDMGGAQATLTIDQSIPSLTDMLEARRGSNAMAFVNYRNEELIPPVFSGHEPRHFAFLASGRAAGPRGRLAAVSV